LLDEICKYVGARFVRADGNRHLNRSDGSTDLSACGPTFPGNQVAATAANFAVNFAVHKSVAEARLKQDFELRRKNNGAHFTPEELLSAAEGLYRPPTSEATA
jgi:hypothetical protein